MAAAAVEAELAVVYVVGTVTVAAATALALHGGKRLAVAGVAGRVAVRAGEREPGPQVVIELPGQPVDRVVAGGAIVAVTPLVGIVVAVAVDANLRRVAENVGLMAAVAGSVGMCAEQREPGQVVIEEQVVLPG